MTAVLETEDPDLLLALGDVARARGMAQVAKDAGLGRESLYKALAPGAKPRFDIEQALAEETAARQAFWSEAVAVGGLSFVDKVKDQLGIRALHREIAELNATHRFREPESAYGIRAGH